MLKINLIKNGKEKVYIQKFISLRMLREALVLGKTVFSDKPIFEDKLDEIVDFIVRLYSNQFTSDELYDGFEGNKIMTKVISDINIVLGKVDEKVEDMEVPEKN